ncbi:MAG: D-aminoacyl-tRNA deacylase [Verrucomicrobiota bacterium]
MRALIQRVSQASIIIDKKPGGSIGSGLVVFLGVHHDSKPDEAKWLAEKILKLKLFDDAAATSSNQKSITDTSGGILIVSQFTLHASTRKGTKPSYHRAAAPEIAQPLYDVFVRQMRQLHTGAVENGHFGAYMEVSLTNDGPLTIMIDSKLKE